MRFIYFVFHNDYINLHYHQPCLRVAFSLYPCQHLSFHFFDNSHTTRCRVISHCGFDLHSLMISDIEHLGHLYVFFRKMSIQVLYPVFNKVVTFFVIELDISHFSDIWFANIFYHSTGCIFISLILSFAMQRFFCLFDVVQLVCFWFFCLCF